MNFSSLPRLLILQTRMNAGKVSQSDLFHMSSQLWSLQGVEAWDYSFLFTVALFPQETSTSLQCTSLWLQPVEVGLPCPAHLSKLVLNAKLTQQRFIPEILAVCIPRSGVCQLLPYLGPLISLVMTISRVEGYGITAIYMGKRGSVQSTNYCSDVSTRRSCASPVS